jgi:hypothetical protein
MDPVPFSGGNRNSVNMDKKTALFRITVSCFWKMGI